MQNIIILKLIVYMGHTEKAQIKILDGLRQFVIVTTVHLAENWFRT